MYDATEDDYIAMLCAQGYNTTLLALVTGSNATRCSGSIGDLNYPTMAAHIAPGKNFNITFARTVTYVGATPDNAVYASHIILAPSNDAPELRVSLSSGLLQFSENSRTASYTVTASGVAPDTDKVISAAIVWSDGKDIVRSPLVLYTGDVDANTSALG